jgi:tRNA A-37 threonylcarbamoyl transferase component Bud32
VGYSGVDLTLIEWPHRAVVRKQARHVAQSERLRQQARKLAWAHAAGFRCPAVRDDGIEDGLYWFDMDYIPGESLANGLISGRAIDWPKVVGQVAEVLLRFRAYADAMLDPATFVDKLADIRDRCAGRDVLRPLRQRLDGAVGALVRLDWTCVPGSASHGDMTLENILLRPDGSLTFIDFDVPQQSSFALDIGKIYQDLLGQWFLRHLVLRDSRAVDLLNARLNLARAALHFDAEFAAMLPGGAGRMRQFAAFHLMRTLPYAADSAVPGFVLDRVEALIG